jgi:hypothetical protein
VVAALSFAQLFQGFELSREADGCRDTTLAMYKLAYHSILRSLRPEAAADAAHITSQDLLVWGAASRPLATATLPSCQPTIRLLSAGSVTWHPASVFTSRGQHQSS